MTYKAGDIVLTVFPFADLTSRKKRPVLIVSGESLSRDRGEYIGLMITSHEARDSWDVEVSDWRKRCIEMKRSRSWFCPCTDPPTNQNHDQTVVVLPILSPFK